MTVPTPQPDSGEAGELEKLRQVIDDGVLTHTGRSIGDRASELVAEEAYTFVKWLIERERLEAQKLAFEWILDAEDQEVDADNRPTSEPYRLFHLSSSEVERIEYEIDKIKAKLTEES